MTCTATLLVVYEARFDRYRPQARPGAWRKPDVRGAGILYDLGAHRIDQALLLFGKPERVHGRWYRQRQGVHACDAFDLVLHDPKHTARLKSSLLVREPGPQIVVHGTHASFLKVRADPQENDLRRGRSPLADGRGRAGREQWGRLHTEMNGLRFDGCIESLPGCDQNDYLNLRDAIRSGAALAVTPNRDWTLCA